MILEQFFFLIVVTLDFVCFSFSFLLLRQCAYAQYIPTNTSIFWHLRCYFNFHHFKLMEMDVIIIGNGCDNHRVD